MKNNNRKNHQPTHSNLVGSQFPKLGRATENYLFHMQDEKRLKLKGGKLCTK